jgi:hypothetical protein
MAITFSRVVRMAYPVVIALASATYIWTNSIHKNNATASERHQTPEVDLFFQRTHESEDQYCTLKDRLRLTTAQSCSREADRPRLFVDGAMETFASQMLPQSLNARN